MNIEEKLEELQKDIAYMRVDVLAIREYVVDISKELQKLQQPKVCKWRDTGMVDDRNERLYWGCEGGEYIINGEYCCDCGGKIEIDKENVQK